LMGITMWMQQKLNPAPTDPTQAMVFAWLPFVFMFMLGSFEAGLVIYWTANNILTFAQQYAIMRSQGVDVDFFGNVTRSFKKKREEPAAAGAAGGTTAQQPAAVTLDKRRDDADADTDTGTDAGTDTGPDTGPNSGTPAGSDGAQDGPAGDDDARGSGAGNDGRRGRQQRRGTPKRGKRRR
ncbi:MAG: YidC/Oxa1 family membrane protein insertase, partial [Pseudomonadota bacterium]